VLDTKISLKLSTFAPDSNSRQSH